MIELWYNFFIHHSNKCVWIGNTQKIYKEIKAIFVDNQMKSFIRFCSCYQFPDKMDFLLMSRTWFTHIFVLCVFFIVRQTPRKIICSTKQKLSRFNEGIVIHRKSHKFISRSYATLRTYDVHQFWKYSYHPKQLKVYDNFLIKIMTAMQ